MSYETQIPTSGGTTSASTGVIDEILLPASGGFSFSYVLPPAPTNGDKHHVGLGVFEPALTISSLSTSDGAAIVGKTSGIAVSYGAGLHWLFDASVGVNGTWYSNN